MYNSKRMATKMIGILLGIVSIAVICVGCGHDTELEDNKISESSVVTTTTNEETTNSTTSTAVTTTTSVKSTTSTSSSNTTDESTTTTSVETVVKEIEQANEPAEKAETVYNRSSINNSPPVEMVETEAPEPEVTQSEIEVEITKKSVEEIAQEVWRGLWGNGAERKANLEAMGYDYDEVQKAVAELRSSFTPATPVNNEVNSNAGGNMTYVKNFSRGTYYAYGGARYGGSGRSLIDCSQGDGTVKGSIASSYLYNNYGYNYNGKRTMVYLEIAGYDSMNGYYYLDDSDAGNSNVIDFFYLSNGNCQFQYQGVVSVDCYIVSY